MNTTIAQQHKPTPKPGTYHGQILLNHNSYIHHSHNLTKTFCRELQSDSKTGVYIILNVWFKKQPGLVCLPNTIAKTVYEHIMWIPVQRDVIFRYIKSSHLFNIVIYTIPIVRFYYIMLYYIILWYIILLENQISILKGFLEYHVTLKPGAMVAKYVANHHRNTLHFKIKFKTENGYFKL